MPRISIGDCSLYYERHGVGFPVLFVSGLGGFASFWQDQVATFAKRFEVVTFDLAGECYALETRLVRRIEQTEAPSPIPGGPDHLIGVVNLHGEVLAIFDLRALLGIARPEATGQTRVLVVGDGSDEFERTAVGMSGVHAGTILFASSLVFSCPTLRCSL